MMRVFLSGKSLHNRKIYRKATFFGIEQEDLPEKLPLKWRILVESRENGAISGKFSSKTAIIRRKSNISGSLSGY
ncbi:hypothetical protein SD70_00020 [Gordoniibacillus kamchatkensis]|uniref:Uncharacterized protein n=1 Tax=Gordoniibacillus kamchatkensis TaxID=1590651 RepID=A0ABR5AMX4_9BACL|nr:hypothetical protein [Paenibacillus sp. VKM B-2647]KIL42374.1 hypothetical protein SD70_00020 [Paenibacillus sp. VKM B-2647]